MAEATSSQANQQKERKQKKKRTPTGLNNSGERRGSQESLLQEDDRKENPKLSRARQRTRERFESLLQAAAEEGLAEEAEKTTKKKKRTKTADSLLSELKSGAPFLKERSKSEERLLAENLYKEDTTPKFKKKKAKEPLQDDTNKDQLQLPLEDEKDSTKQKGKTKKKGSRKKQKEDVAANNEDEETGKENIAYDQSPLKEEVDGPGSVAKRKKKKKRQNTEPAGEVIERALQRKRRDDGYLLCIELHKADRLKPDINVLHPCIRVHVVDINTGQYVKKSDRQRNVASVFEGQNESVDYIMPLITQPYDFRKERSMLPCWQEVLLYNEIYSYFLQREEGDPDVIIFFEIMDFLSMSSVLRGRQQGAEQGWFKIAWAFLKVVSTNGSPNTDRKVRLQFYQPPTRLRVRNPMPGAIQVFQWWQSTERIAYPSTLYVTVKGIRPPDNIDAATRSMYPIQEERGKVTFEELNSTLDGVNARKRPSLSLDQKHIWNRLPGQANRIPNKLALILPTGRKGCSVSRFSPDGRILACACAGADGYPVLVYEIPSGTLQGELSGHFGIVYDMSWTPDSKELLTASSDGTVRSWDANRFVSNAIKLYPHPSFVYAARHHPTSYNLIVSGGYDRVVRVWSKTTDNLHGKLLREMTGHNGFINTITFQPSGDQMYSGDSTGVIIIWNCSVTDGKRKSKAAADEENVKSWRVAQTLKLEEIKNTPINSLTLHPGGRKMLVHARDAFIRMLDLRSSAIMKRYLGALNQKEHIRSTTSTCGNFVISGSEDGTAYVWNSETGDPVYEYDDLGYTNAVSDAHFHPHENMVVFCSFGAGHPVLVYIFDMEEQMKSTKLNETTATTLRDDQGNLTSGQTMDSTLRSLHRPLSQVSDGGDIEKERLRAEKMKQRMASVMDSNRTPEPASTTRTSAHPQKSGVRFGETSDTMMTWGSDFASTLPSPSPYSRTERRSSTSPHALQHFGSSRTANQNQTKNELTSPGIRQTPTASPYFGAIEAQIHDSPLTLSHLQASTKPVFSFNAGASQRKKAVQKRKVIVIYAYEPNRADELQLKPNDIITVVFEDNENWWMGELPDGRQGYFPTNYVMDQEEDLREVSSTRENADSSRISHSAVMSKDGDLKIISMPEDSGNEARSTQRRKQRRRKAHRSNEDSMK